MVVQSMTMTCKTLMWLTLAAAILAGVQAWGGLFNRFNPAMMGDGGGAYAAQLFKAAEKAMQNGGLRGLRENCHGDRCTANEQCCQDHVCVDADEEEDGPRRTPMPYGTCLPIFGKSEGEICLSDSDCHSDFVCSPTGLDDATSTCQPPDEGTQSLGESCRTSSDCMTSRGLCCKLQRRARSQPKKICSYYTESRSCIGVVRVESVNSNNDFEHTAGEKRMSGHPDLVHFHNYFN